MSLNEARRNRAKRALDAHSGNERAEAGADRITDLLADLMHLSDHYEMDFHHLVSRARRHHHAEVLEEERVK